jgi:hypothetical protein
MKYYTEREDVVYVVRQFTGEQCAIIHCAPEPGKEFPELFGESPNSIEILKSEKLSEGIFYISFQDNNLKINDAWWCVVEGTPVTDVVNFFLNYREKAIEEALIASVKVIQEFNDVPWQDLVAEFNVGGLELNNVSGSDSFTYYTFLNEERNIKATVQVPCFEGRGIKVFWE